MTSKTETPRRSASGNSKSKRRRRDGDRAGNGQPGHRWGDHPSGERWEDWVQHLAGRRKAISLAKLVPSSATIPLTWGLHEVYPQMPAPRLWKRLMRLASQPKPAVSKVIDHAGTWLDNAAAREPDAWLGLECVAWAHGLPRLAPRVSSELWCGLLDQLVEIAGAAAGLSIADDPLAHQLLGGELPLTLACLFPELPRLAHLRKPASRTLSFGAVELLDGEGLPNARHLSQLRPLLACWTRCAMMSAAAGWACFDDDGQNQYEWSVRQALRLSRSDGTQVFSSASDGDRCHDLFEAALRLTGDPADQQVARCVWPKRHGKSPRRVRKKLPEPSVHSEWAEMCVMRAKWARKSAQFAILFDRGRLRTELSVANRLVWSGGSQPQLCVDGRENRMCGDWAELCWFTDDEVDYLELEADHEDGWKVQRQFLLSRSDHFLLVADAVLGPSVADLEYHHRFPLAGGVCFECDPHTRDGQLVGDKVLGSVLPLALPEWQPAPAPGELCQEDGHLHLSQSGRARGLYAPLLLDLLPRRLGADRTWRQLTVAERLETQRADVAVGFRVQLGRAQWLIYRSLAPTANRSVIGQNLSQEFLVARFDRDGTVRELLEIE